MHLSAEIIKEKSFRVRWQNRERAVFRKGGGRKGRAKKASLAVECALCLPLFLFLFLPLIAYPQVLSYQAEENLALSNAARKLSVAAHLTGGEGWIDLRKQGRYTLPSPALPLPDVKIALRARVYPFTGYVPGSDDADAETGQEDGMVFVTDHLSVYHTHADCTHLSLSVYATSLTAAKSMRNAYGKKYKACPGFPEGYTGQVYLTEKGEFYYPYKNYGSLTRHVHLVSKDSCDGLALCSRCAARGAGEEFDAAA